MKLAFPSKKNILKSLLIMWIIFSVGYIGWSVWTNITSNLMRQAYQQGINDSVNQLIEEAEKTDCQPIDVYNKEQKKDVKLINIACLTKPK